jgi:hypothetical protein
LSGFSDFFTSPSERAAANVQNPYDNVSNLSDVYKNYGLQPFDLSGYDASVKASYQPQKQALATQKGMALRNSLRSNRNATPGQTNAGIETAFANENSALDTGEANQEMQGIPLQMQSQQYNASFLDQLLGQRQQGDYEHANALSHASTFDDIMAGLNTASKFATPFLMPKPQAQAQLPAGGANTNQIS